MNKFNTMIASIEGVEDIDYDYDDSAIEKVVMYVPRCKFEATTQAEDENLIVHSARLVYPDGMEHTRVVVEGARFNLNEYACVVDAYESPTMQFDLEDFRENNRALEAYAKTAPL